VQIRNRHGTRVVGHLAADCLHRRAEQIQKCANVDWADDPWDQAWSSDGFCEWQRQAPSQSVSTASRKNAWRMKFMAHEATASVTRLEESGPAWQRPGSTLNLLKTSDIDSPARHFPGQAGNADTGGIK
jgi:hypothetical protein